MILVAGRRVVSKLCIGFYLTNQLRINPGLNPLKAFAHSHFVSLFSSIVLLRNRRAKSYHELVLVQPTDQMKEPAKKNLCSGIVFLQKSLFLHIRLGRAITNGLLERIEGRPLQRIRNDKTRVLFHEFKLLIG